MAGQLLISGAATFFSVRALPDLVDSCLSKETAPVEMDAMGLGSPFVRNIKIMI